VVHYPNEAVTSPSACAAEQRVTVLLSVPYARNARFLLSSSAYPRLQQRFDVVVVSPFAESHLFRSEFDGPNTMFARPAQPRSRLRLRLFERTEAVRFMGYWFIHRKRTAAQYWAERRKTGIAEWLRTLQGALAAPPSLWRLLDRLVARWVHDTTDLDASVNGPAVVVLTANWGYQSRMLAWWASRRGYPCVLLPYTTDQLTVNGHLIADFAAICVQGRVERDCAAMLHGVASARVLELGNVWFRNIDAWRQRTMRPTARKMRKRLLYGGIASAYFPKSSEREALQALVAACSDGTLPPCDVVYRPIGNVAELAEIQRLCAATPGLTLQLPEPAMFGMEQYGDRPIGDDIDSYLSGLAAADVFVMSAMTTMALDALYMDIPVVANFGNLDLTVTERRLHPRLKYDPLRLLDSGIAIAFTPKDIVSAVGDALNGSVAHSMAREQVLQRWDADSTDWEERLVSLLQRLGAEGANR
jgi:hypothetical protein